MQLSSLDESFRRVGGGVFFQSATHTAMPEGCLANRGRIHKGRGRPAPIYQCQQETSGIVLPDTFSLSGY